jgi:hypothetical protein
MPHLRTTALLAALALLAAPAASALPIGAGAFGALAVVESFEGQTPGPNIPLGLGVSLLHPGTVSAFAFPSGVALTAPIPNPGYAAGGAFLHDFALGADVHNHWGGARIVNDAGDVPFGSAYVGAFAPGPGTVSLTFTFAAPMQRVGAYVSGLTASTVALDVYDDSDALVGSHVVGTVELAQWGTNFLGFEHLAGIRRAVFRGVDFGLDGLTFEAGAIPVPEPGTLSALALGLAGLAGLALFGSRPAGPARAAAARR